MVVGESLSTAFRRALKFWPLVLQTSDEAAILMTRSVFGRIWHARAKP